MLNETYKGSLSGEGLDVDYSSWSVGTNTVERGTQTSDTAGMIQTKNIVLVDVVVRAML